MGVGWVQFAGRRVVQNRLPRLEDWLRLQNHPFAAAERPIVYCLVPIVSELPQVVNADIDQARLSRPAHNAVMQRPVEKLREDGNDVELHRLGLTLGAMFASFRTRLYRLGAARSGGI